MTSPIWHCPGLYSLELGYQERYDNYSDFGSTEKPKVFFRWQLIDSSLTFRGTYNEASHAPALYELFTSPFMTSNRWRSSYSASPRSAWETAW